MIVERPHPVHKMPNMFRRRRWCPLMLMLLLLSASGCGPRTSPANDQSGPPTISAAVSLKDAFNEIGGLYEAKTGKAVTFNYGSSGALQRQIEAGAPVDVFASAGEKQMDELAAGGYIADGTRQNFATNRLVVVVPKDSGAAVKEFNDLAGPLFKKIAVGNPRTVPAGQYADQAISSAGLSDSLRPKLVLAEDVRQVLDYVVRGEVDAGIVYASDALSAGDGVRTAFEVPGVLHGPIVYPIAIVKDSSRNRSGREFIDLVVSGEGQRILKKYGFDGVPER
jgi:molybdate transport system substrate-binding protein